MLKAPLYLLPFAVIGHIAQCGGDPDVSIYYVDCLNGSDAATGTSPDTAWKSLDKANALTLGGGSSVLLKRGTTCVGALHPAGSSTVDNPITLGAYGDGELPVIDASGQEAGIALSDQSGFHIEQLEIRGSGPYGVLIEATRETVSHIRLTDLKVHDVFAGEISTKSTGLVVVNGTARGGRFDDVVVDGVTAWNTDQWSGIFIAGASFGTGTELGSNITIRNSTVHDTFGDGIVIFSATDSLIETSVAFRTGLQEVQTIGTPNGIWTWQCDRCTVQYNEGYETYSPGTDGGVYDIDYYTNDNTVQYNYGHHAQAYCVAVFGAENSTTTNAIVRYNVCAHNGRLNPALGDFYTATWSGGTIDGLQIYNNTSYWDPAEAQPALVDLARYTGSMPRYFVNNLIYTTTGYAVDTGLSLGFDNNLYWNEGGSPTQFTSNTEPGGGVVFPDFASWQQATGQDAHGLFADPKLVGSGDNGVGDFQLTAVSPAINAGRVMENSGGCDYWGGAVSDTPDIGAHEYGASPGSDCQP